MRSYRNQKSLMYVTERNLAHAATRSSYLRSYKIYDAASQCPDSSFFKDTLSMALLYPERRATHGFFMGHYINLAIEGWLVGVQLSNARHTQRRRER